MNIDKYLIPNGKNVGVNYGVFSNKFTIFKISLNYCNNSQTPNSSHVLNYKIIMQENKLQNAIKLRDI